MPEMMMNLTVFVQWRNLEYLWLNTNFSVGYLHLIECDKDINTENVHFYFGAMSNIGVLDGVDSDRVSSCS